MSTIAILPAIVLTAALLLRFRPKQVARFNRVVTNRITRLFARWAPRFGIVIHRGRKSGRLYKTPVNVFALREGFLIALTYGRDSEWVKNVLAAGGCEIETRGIVHKLSTPVIMHGLTDHRLPWLVSIILRIIGVTDYLQLSKPHPL
jgi:deazaflavin-dependent oxidoreductase (nitroreductase family)